MTDSKEHCVKNTATVTNTVSNVESFYPLSPMQQGMLFHSLFEPASGMYVELLSVQLKGRLDVPVFIQTWQKVVERHPILRTAFLWESVKEPVQVVYQKVNLNFSVLDWRRFSPEEQTSKLDEYLKYERLTGFDLNQAPLMRQTLIQTADQEYHFVWMHHHILLDGWSIPLLLNEVFALYTGLIHGIEPDLPVSRPFRDYIVWLKRQNLADSESYWREKLSGFVAPTPIPIVGLEKDELTSEPEFSEIEVNLSRGVTTSLQTLARQNGLTLNTLFQGAWAILLSRYSGEEDIIFGSTVSGRPTDLPGSESILGLFINTLPVRVQVDPKSELIVFLKNLQVQQAEMRQYEYTPLMQIQGWSQVPRGMPLFESILVFENFPIGQSGSETASELSIHGGQSASHTNFPLTVVAAPGAEISLKISYNQQLFSQQTIQRMLGHLQTILIGMANHEMAQHLDQMVFGRSKPALTVTLSSLPMLTSDEKQQLLEVWNRQEATYTIDRCIHEWVEEQVLLCPEAIAVTYEGQSLTYYELNQRANKFAHYLIQLGVRPESMVGLFMERNLDLVVAILGILKAGGAYVPLDPTYPADRLGFIVGDYSQLCMGFSTVSDPSLQTSGDVASDTQSTVPGDGYQSILVTQQSKIPDLPDTEARIISIDSEWDHVSRFIEQSFAGNPKIPNPVSGVTSDNLAYVIYTSGSTGKPKGVMVTHANVVRLFKATDSWYHFDQTDVWTLFHSYAFDFSVWEIWGALFYGGRLVIVPYLVSRSPDAFYSLLCNEKVTVLNQTPSAFRQLMHAEEVVIEDATYEAGKLALRYVIFGGEALELQSLKPWFDRHGDQQPQLVNMYGITETTVHVTYRPIYMADLQSSSGSVIGRAIPDLEVFIFDKNQQPVPIGIPGELYVGGAGVARGYLNRSELTDQRFVPIEKISSLSGRKPGVRVYRSGDLARYLSNGDIEYLGRIDHQVKIRGFRVELGEIESVIVQSAGVREAVVLDREDDGYKRLVAYLVMKDVDEELSIAEVRHRLSEKLPDYMIPSAYIVLPAFPLTTNGKIDRRALLSIATPDQVQLSRQHEFFPPRTAEEQTVADLWSKLLGVDRVGLFDNFFELGGDSILSIQFISRAKQAGLNVSYRQLFEHPVLKDLVLVISLEQMTEVQPDISTGPLTLTPIQHWFFAHHQHHPEHFNTSIMFEVWQDLDVNIIQETLRDLIQHHDALRSQFHSVDGAWSVEIPAMLDRIDYETVYLKTKNETRIASEVYKIANKVQAGFDLTKGPLVKVIYLKGGADLSGRLLFIFHHLVFDGVSMRIFVEDFLSVYLQRMSGRPVELPDKTSSYKSWSERLVRYSQSAEILNELNYWRAMASKVYGKIPLDHSYGENTYGETDTITHALGVEETTALLHQATAFYGVRFHTILITAWLRALRRWTGMSNYFVEMEGHGREIIPGTALDGVDLSRTTGWFTSIYPVYLELGDNTEIDSADLSVQELRSIEEQIRMIPNNGIGYGILRYLLPEVQGGKDSPGIEAVKDNADLSIHDPLQNFPDPELNFNYLGVFDQSGVEIDVGEASNVLNVFEDMVPFAISNDSVGDEQSPNEQRSAKLYVVAAVGGNQLGVRWLFSRGIHKPETINRVAQYFMQELSGIVKKIGK